MVISLGDLIGYKVRAVDQEIGKVDDFLFDDQNWLLRYLLIDAGEWLDNKRILISTTVFGMIDPDVKTFPVELTADLIRNSPLLDTDSPEISRQFEAQLAEYYKWPQYWVPDGFPGVVPGGLASYPMVEMMSEVAHERSKEAQSGGISIRSYKDVTGYQIDARDGDIGVVDDFITEADNWRILYMIVATGTWLPGKKVLISPSWIENINWASSLVHVDLSRETILNSPEYDPSVQIDREYETRLFDHYQRKRYW